MVFFNYALRKLNAKIVYYGPGLCGKTTNLQWIHDHFEGGQRGKMISLATEGDRTIFFDLLPIDIGSIRGMDVTLQLYTVPGQVHYNSTRQLVLRGADGVVFVADSQRTMRSSNVESFENLQENLMLQGIDIKDFPHILQFNKRDLRDLLSTEDLNESLNVFSCPIFEAIATEGIGVQESLEGIVKLVMRNLREKYEPVANATGPQAPPPMQVTGPTAYQSPPVEKGRAAPEQPGSDFVPHVEPPPVLDPLDQLGATFKVPSVEIPTTVAPPYEETQDVGPDSGFAAFEDEDGVPTAVYEEGATDIADYESALGSSDFVSDGPSGSADQESSFDETPSLGSDRFEGLFTDPRDEDGTSEGELAPKPAGPIVEPEVIEELQTDPEFPADDLQSDSPNESLDDLFEAEVPSVRTFVDDAIGAVVAESPDPDDFVNAQETENVPVSEADVVAAGPVDPDDFVNAPEPENAPIPEINPVAVEPVDPDDFVNAPESSDIPEIVVAPPSNDRYEDRIQAPGPFAPNPAVEEADDDEADDFAASAEAEQAEADRQAVHEEVRQALGASEDRVALASLSEGLREETFEPDEDGDEPEEVQPVVPPPPEEPTSADTIEAGDHVAAPFFESIEDAEIEDAIAMRGPESTEPEIADPEVAEPDFADPEIPEPAFAEVEVEEAVAEPPLMGEPVEEERSAPPAETMGDPHAKGQPIVFGSGDPFASYDVEPTVVEVLPEEAPIVPVRNRIEVTAEDNQLHLQLKGSGAIAEIGQVRALDIEVPVPGQWVGNRKVTLQLRLTLTPAEDEND